MVSIAKSVTVSVHKDSLREITPGGGKTVVVMLHLTAADLAVLPDEFTVDLAGNVVG